MSEIQTPNARCWGRGTFESVLLNITGGGNFRTLWVGMCRWDLGTLYIPELVNIGLTSKFPFFEYNCSVQHCLIYFRNKVLYYCP